MQTILCYKNTEERKDQIIMSLSYLYYKNKIQLSQTQFRVLYYMLEKANWDLESFFIMPIDEVRKFTHLSLSQVKNSLQTLKSQSLISSIKSESINRKLNKYSFSPHFKNSIFEFYNDRC